MDKPSDSKLSTSQSSKGLPRAGTKPLPQATPLPAAKKAPIAQKTQPEAIPVAALAKPADNTVKPADDDAIPILVLDETASPAKPVAKAAPATADDTDDTAGNEAEPAWDDSEILPVTTSVSKIHRRKTAPPVPRWQPIAVIAGIVVFVGGVVVGLLIYFRGNQPADNDTTGAQTAQTPQQLVDKAAHSPRPNPSAALPRVVTAPARTAPAPQPAAGAEGSPAPAPELSETAKLAKLEDDVTAAMAVAKTPENYRAVAAQWLILADQAIVQGDAQLSSRAVVAGLAAARQGESLELAKRATVLYIQLREPPTDAVKEQARNRLLQFASTVQESNSSRSNGSGSNARESPSSPFGSQPTLRPAAADPDFAAAPPPSKLHEVRWNKTEDERKKIFFDLLAAVDDFGMTAEGRKAWHGILQAHAIDRRVTLGILNEGFDTYCDWEQPSKGKASARMNRMEWVARRTRTMSEPMLTE